MAKFRNPGYELPCAPETRKTQIPRFSTVGTRFRSTGDPYHKGPRRRRGPGNRANPNMSQRGPQYTGAIPVGPPPPHRGPGTLGNESAFPSPWPNSVIQDTNFRAPRKRGKHRFRDFLPLGPVSDRPEIRTIRARAAGAGPATVPTRICPSEDHSTRSRK